MFARLLLGWKTGWSLRCFELARASSLSLRRSLIVNFTARTVQGTARWGPFLFDDQLPITEWNEATVVFEGFRKFLGRKISGSMDRVTGNVGMVATAKEAAVFDYSLNCSPTQRKF
jgi:hypothetical protein